MLKPTRVFPGLLWLKGYDLKIFRSDLLSGITIAAMLIPQSMGYAMVAGLPAEYGLYACIFPPIIYALLGTSNKLSMGPVALDSILILTGLSVLAEPGSDNYLTLAITLTLLVGLIQVLFGLFRFGFIANFLSYPVILGYTCAAALIIIGTQLGNLLGVELEATNPLMQLVELLRYMGDWHWLTAGIGLLGLAVLIYAPRVLPALPWGLLLLATGMFVSGTWQASQHGVAVVPPFPQGLPTLQLSSLSPGQFAALLPTALTVALMGYVGSMSICKAQESPTDARMADPNQELVAVGMANVVGALFRAFPVSASFSRSAAFVRAGALTQVSAVASSITIALTLLFLTPLFASYPLPTALLSSVIIVSVAGLFKYPKMKALLKQDRHEFLIMLATFSITLLLGVQYGLLAGVTLSVARLIYNTARPHMTELGSMQGGRLYRNVSRFEEVTIREDVLIFRFDAPLFFANKDFFMDRLFQWIKQRKEDRLKSVVFVAEAVNSVDSTAIQMLERVIGILEQQGIRFYITNAIGPVRDALHNSPLCDYLCEESMFATIHDAIDYIDHGVTAADGVALQTAGRS